MQLLKTVLAAMQTALPPVPSSGSGNICHIAACLQHSIHGPAPALVAIIVIVIFLLLLQGTQSVQTAVQTGELVGLSLKFHHPFMRHDLAHNHAQPS
jgi:type IV secretory pathway VirB2 component (pilin)